MATRLTWDEIKTRFDQQWVLLTDFDWPDGTPYPTAGVVGIHAHDKKDFDQALKKSQGTRPKATAIVYVGTPPRQPNEIHLNLFTLNKCA